MWIPKIPRISEDQIRAIYEHVPYLHSARWRGESIFADDESRFNYVPEIRLLVGLLSVPSELRIDVIANESLREGMLNDDHLGLLASARMIADENYEFASDAAARQAIVDVVSSYAEQCPAGLLTVVIPSILCWDAKLVQDAIDIVFYGHCGKNRKVDATMQGVLIDSARRLLKPWPNVDIGDIKQAYGELSSAIRSETRRADRFGSLSSRVPATANLPKVFADALRIASQSP
jgi:hypothetical protein